MRIWLIWADEKMAMELTRIKTIRPDHLFFYRGKYYVRVGRPQKACTSVTNVLLVVTVKTESRRERLWHHSGSKGRHPHGHSATISIASLGFGPMAE